VYFFIGFWKLETKNSFLPIFNLLHKLSFENNFCFLFILDCQISFLISKIKNCFRKQKIKGKNSYQTYPYFLSKIIPNLAWLCFLFLSRDCYVYESIIWAWTILNVFVPNYNFYRWILVLLVHSNISLLAIIIFGHF